MGKGDKKSRRGKITAGSYGVTRPRKKASALEVPVKVMDADEEKAPKTKVRQQVGEQTEPTDNAEVSKKTKATKAESPEEKPKATRKKKTE